MTINRSDEHSSKPPSYIGSKFLVVMTILMILMITDVSLIRIYDFISKQFIPVYAREILFAVISSGCLAAMFVLLELIRPLRTNLERRTKLYIRPIYRVTKFVQYALGVFVLYVILQILLNSSYHTFSLTIIIASSYILSIAILSIFIVRMIGLITFSHNVLVFVMFVIAVGSLTTNIVITLVNVSLRLSERPLETKLILGASSDIGKGRFNVIDNLYFISYLISFVTAWIATATLLHYYTRKFGNLKYWLIVAAPMAFFLAQFSPSYMAYLPIPSLVPNQFYMATLTTLISTISKPLAGLMLGITFWSMAKLTEIDSPVRKYLVFSGFGFFFLFSSNQAILMSIAPYPPFGIVTVTALGMSAYMMVVGLYTSTVSMSQDSNLRRTMKRVAKSQSTLFDSITSAESAKEIEASVMELVRKQSIEMEDKSGIETSLSDQEVREYLNEVLDEVKKRKV